MSRRDDPSQQDEPLVADLQQQDAESAEAREAKQKFRANVILGITVASMILAAAAAVMLSTEEKKINLADIADVSELILDAEKMGEVAGFVPAPLYVLTAKGYFNFSIQIVIYIGCSRILQGRAAMIERLEQKVRFSSVSLFFQALGLTSTAFAYSSLAVAVCPFRDWLSWQMFVYVVAVHSGTITLMVGAFNNALISEVIVDDPNVAYSEEKVSRGFAALGFTMALPIWAGMLSTCWIGTLIWILPGVVVAGILLWLLARDDVGLQSSIRQEPFSAAALSAVVVNLMIMLTWLCFQIESLETWHLVGAVALELYIPIMVLLFVSVLNVDKWSEGAAYPVMLKGFWLGMTAAFIINMSLPASLVASGPTGGIGSAAPSVFIQKKGASFLNYTFVVPVQQAHDAMEDFNDTYAYAHQTQIALAQVLSLFT